MNTTDAQGMDSSCGAHCITMKKTMMGYDDQFLGSFIVTNPDSGIYDDDNVDVSAYYAVLDWGGEIAIPKENIDKFHTVILLNCISNHTVVGE